VNDDVQSPLLEFAGNVTSQDGEDGIIQKIFETLPPTNRFCVEFGAWDGKYLSNCCNLISNFNWGGCFIEANPNRFEELRNNHGSNDKVICINRFIELDGQNSLDNILSSAGIPKDFDFLSIDVDGTD
ncbi:hypothetical protein, partial [uncultured Thiodictyon sp.]|uniref:hypothetical protein n=1 Tax=uncultured Thiodictyon sp. TaxID=1846217 RepID=UPI0025E917BF